MVASFRSSLDDWRPLADWAVAIGTAALAIFTAYLGKQAKREATAVAQDSMAIREQSAAVREQVELQRAMSEASVRPYVYATATPSWSKGGQESGTDLHWYQYVPVTNGGLGPAVTIMGGFEGPDGEWRDFVPVSLASGQSTYLLLSRELSGSREALDGKSGWLTYRDLRGQEWRSTFTIWWNGLMLYIDASAVPESTRVDR